MSLPSIIWLTTLKVSLCSWFLEASHGTDYGTGVWKGGLLPEHDFIWWEPPR